MPKGDDGVPLYAQVHKVSTSFRDDSFQDIDLHDNDVYDAGQADDVIALDSDDSGPELDYAARDRSLSCDVARFDLAHAPAETKQEVSTNSANKQPPAVKKTTSLQDIPSAAKRDKQTSQFTKKLGKYFRKLKPKKKQKFTPPHDLDAPSLSKTYVAFEHCDSDAEILNSVKPVASPGRSPAGPPLDPDLYEIAHPASDDDGQSSYEQSMYEDITAYSARPRSRVLTANYVTNDASIYDLAQACPYNDSAAANEADEPSSPTVAPVLNDAKTEATSAPHVVPPQLPPRDEIDDVTAPAKQDADEKPEFFVPADAMPDCGSSDASLDSLLPDPKDWDKVSQTSEDEFIEQASRDVLNDQLHDGQAMNVSNDSDSNEAPDPDSELLKPTSSLLDKVSLKSDEDTSSIDSRRSSVTQLDHDDAILEHDDHVTEYDDHVSDFVGQVIPEEADDVDDNWSPQATAADYGTLKRTTSGKRKSGWVSALKKIYEKPQRKMSKVMKNSVWRSRSMSNVTDDVLPIENPKYAEPMRKATSTQSLQTIEKKRRRFPWKRKKSKEVVVLPTSPSNDCLAAMDDTNNEAGVGDDDDENVTSPLELYHSNHVYETHADAIKPRQSSDSGYISKVESPFPAKKSKQFPWKSKKKLLK